MTSSRPQPSFLSTPRGKVTLALLCAVALPGFRRRLDRQRRAADDPAHLHFSVQSLQWVLSGYLLTYGGFMLLGGRAADLLGRRRLLVAGTGLFAASSLTAGLSSSEGMLIAARLVQGLGAAMTFPAALSMLTTTFHEGSERPERSAPGGHRRTGLGRSACSSAGDLPGPRLAMGLLRELAGLRPGAGGNVPFDPRRATPTLDRATSTCSAQCSSPPGCWC